MTDSPSSSTPDYECEPIDCSFPRAVACRVGASVYYVAKTGHFGPRNRCRPPPLCPHRSAPGTSHLEIPPGKLRVFTLEELKRATDSFSRLVGWGGYGDVYKGYLPDGSVVAVKVGRKMSSQGTSQFLAEIQVAERVGTRSDGAKHLLTALGYCHPSKEETMMIVYPFMVYGDLGSYLDVGERPRLRASLDWPMRKRIALGVARGISCLHELRILHCDIKPSNILLDENFEAYVGDFGLAKVGSYDRGEEEMFLFEWDSCDYSCCRGTLGYIAPELFFDFRYSRRSDVYAFGVTLAQLITGKKACSGYNTAEHGWFRLVKWVEDLHKNNALDMMVDPQMGGEYNESELVEMIKLSLVCTQDEAKRRPYMSEVVSILEDGGSEELRERWEMYECREWPDPRTYEWDSTSTTTWLPPEELSGPR